LYFSIGVLDVGEQFRLMMHEVLATAKQIASRAHIARIHVCHRQQAPAQYCGYFLRIDLVVLRLATVDRFHVQGVTEDKVD